MNDTMDMKLPTQEQALGYFDEFAVPRNIVAHCKKVQEVAVFLANEMKKKGMEVDVSFVAPLALLHDIFKVVVLDKIGGNQYHPYEPNEREVAMHRKLRSEYKGMYESEVAYEVFKDRFPELAVSLRDCSNHHKRDKSPEEMLVHYVDWRVLRDEIISLDDRIAYCKEVYHINEFRDDISELRLYENKLFTELRYSPDGLKAKIEAQQ
ncbi:hypothetical protein CL620_05865 [archaeon]|nr:hypothetical protein [archaeon]